MTETDTVGNAILITGAARTGTSLIGQVIHSCQGVEYAYEPAGLLSLYAKMPDFLARPQLVALWKSLYAGYLFRDFLMPTLAGRRLNFREGDESYIHYCKSVSEIGGRLMSSGRDLDVYPRALQSTLAYKLPDILPFLGQFHHFYPKTRLVVLLRNPGDTIASLVQKGWFSDATLAQAWANWPSREEGVPFWVPLGEESSWRDAREVGRAVLYFTWQYLALMTDLRPNDLILVDYDYLVEDPPHEIMPLLQRLGLNPGPKTEGLIQAIRPRAQPKAEDPIMAPAWQTYRELKGWLPSRV